MASVIKYVISSLLTIYELQKTVHHQRSSMEVFMATQLTIYMGVKQTLKESLMIHLRLYTYHFTSLVPRKLWRLTTLF